MGSANERTASAGRYGRPGGMTVASACCCRHQLDGIKCRARPGDRRAASGHLPPSNITTSTTHSLCRCSLSHCLVAFALGFPPQSLTFLEVRLPRFRAPALPAWLPHPAHRPGFNPSPAGPALRRPPRRQLWSVVAALGNTAASILPRHSSEVIHSGHFGSLAGCDTVIFGRPSARGAVQDASQTQSILWRYVLGPLPHV